MNAKEAVELLEKSAEFSEWKKSNKEAYLAHAFTVRDNDKLDDWQIGFYNKAHGKITVFEMGKEIEILPESEVFKREETEVRGLDISRVNIDLAEVSVIAEKLAAESYPQVRSHKQIMILQNLEQGQVWNLTFVSQGLDVLNMKIDAGSGEVLSHNLSRLFEFKNFKDNGSLAS